MNMFFTERFLLSSANIPLFVCSYTCDAPSVGYRKEFEAAHGLRCGF
jgi:hypothetical protein